VQNPAPLIFYVGTVGTEYQDHEAPRKLHRAHGVRAVSPVLPAARIGRTPST
jgi:hypothetical protein